MPKHIFPTSPELQHVEIYHDTLPGWMDWFVRHVDRASISERDLHIVLQDACRHYDVRVE